MNKNNLLFSFLLAVLFIETCEGIKCFNCNSANNSGCLDLHMQKMHAIIPIVDCAKSMPNSISKQFFCRKITQTILHVDQTPEIRITRGCGWVKYKRECYTADNADHLETVCQCFGDLCNAATSLVNVKVTALTTMAAIFLSLRNWRGKL